MSATDPVSPSGDSIIGSLFKGETDPSVGAFQKGRQDILNWIASIFPSINPVFLIAIVIIIILVLIAIIKI